MEHNLFKVAEIQVSYKQRYKIAERPKLNASDEVYQLLLRHWNQNTINLFEEFKCLLLNRTNRVLGIVDISVGGMSGTTVDPKLIFSIALKAGASNIILAHNHPSGNLQPSDSDVRITRKLKEGGKLLEIDVIDHLIITSDSYYSFADDGRL